MKTFFENERVKNEAYNSFSIYGNNEVEYRCTGYECICIHTACMDVLPQIRFTIFLVNILAKVFLEYENH